MHRTFCLLLVADLFTQPTHDAPGRRRKACVRKVPSTPEEGLSGLVVVSTKIDAMENREVPGRAVFSSSGSVSIVHAHTRSVAPEGWLCSFVRAHPYNRHTGCPMAPSRIAPTVLRTLTRSTGATRREKTRLLRTSANWLSGGFSRCQIALQAARSFGQPWPISRLGHAGTQATPALFPTKAPPLPLLWRPLLRCLQLQLCTAARIRHRGAGALLRALPRLRDRTAAVAPGRRRIHQAGSGAAPLTLAPAPAQPQPQP